MTARLGVLLGALALAGAACSGLPEADRASERPPATTTGAQAAKKPPPPAHDFRPAPGITVPRGFRAEIYASGLERPTAMAFGPDGRLYVTEETGSVVRVRPGSTSPRAFVGGFPAPLGLAWKGRLLYVSAQGRVERVRLRAGRATERRTILSRLPFGLHQQDNVVLGPDGRLYLGSGSTCNACAEADPRSATVLSFRPDGSDLEIFSRGLRNPFGLAFQPRTGRLYVSVNSRDDLPNPSSAEPAEMLVVAKKGRHFGWPDCWPSYARRAMVGDCAGITPPAAYLEPHSSADGMAFYTGASFPERYRDDLYIALWGQYASSQRGRRVIRVVLGGDGKAVRNGISTFADGFEHPLAVALDPHGALLVADWGRGVIYRIQARGKP